MPVCVYVHVDSRSLYLVLSLISIYFIFWHSVSQPTQTSTIWLGWPISFRDPNSGPHACPLQLSHLPSSPLFPLVRHGLTCLLLTQLLPTVGRVLVAIIFTHSITFFYTFLLKISSLAYALLAEYIYISKCINIWILCYWFIIESLCVYAVAIYRKAL